MLCSPQSAEFLATTQPSFTVNPYELLKFAARTILFVFKIMKNFLRRLKYYGIGFAFGLVFVFFFFKDRGCSWKPDNRVKNTILGRVLVVPESEQAAFDKLGLNDTTIVAFLNDGDANFSASKKDGATKVYQVSKEIKGKEVKLWFTLPQDAFISEVRFPKGSVLNVKNTKTGMGKMIRFPLVETIVYLNEDDSYFNKMKEKYDLNDSKEVENYLKKNGKIDFAKSNLTSSPYPIQKIVFETPTKLRVTASSYWFEEHITVESFDAVDSLGSTKH